MGVDARLPTRERAAFVLTTAVAVLFQAGCVGPQVKAEGVERAAALACVPTRLEGLSSQYGRPFREEVEDQMARVTPYVEACGRQFASGSLIIVTQWTMSGRTGKVTQLDLSPLRGAGTAKPAISAELAQCVATAFSGVCFLPFDKQEFRVTYPFEAR